MISSAKCPALRETCPKNGEKSKTKSYKAVGNRDRRKKMKELQEQRTKVSYELARASPLYRMTCNR